METHRRRNDTHIQHCTMREKRVWHTHTLDQLRAASAWIGAMIPVGRMLTTMMMMIRNDATSHVERLRCPGMRAYTCALRHSSSLAVAPGERARLSFFTRHTYRCLYRPLRSSLVFIPWRCIASAWFRFVERGERRSIRVLSARADT